MKQAAKALIRNDQGKILVLYRSETCPHYPHSIDLPGGNVEIGETVDTALAREVFEESGVELGFSSDERVYAWRSLFGHKHILYESQTIVSSEVKISWEHEAYTWMAEEEFIATPTNFDFIQNIQALLRTRDTRVIDKLPVVV